MVRDNSRAILQGHICAILFDSLRRFQDTLYPVDLNPPLGEGVPGMLGQSVVHWVWRPLSHDNGTKHTATET